jgi:hypothetical protein
VGRHYEVIGQRGDSFDCLFNPCGCILALNWIHEWTECPVADGLNWVAKAPLICSDGGKLWKENYNSWIEIEFRLVANRPIRLSQTNNSGDLTIDCRGDLGSFQVARNDWYGIDDWRSSLELPSGAYQIRIVASGVGRYVQGPFLPNEIGLALEPVEPVTVPRDFTAIQAALDAAAPNSLIMVSEGTYNEAIDLKGKAITVKAVGARANTIIDGTGKTTSVVRAVTGETSATVLQGFTIRNGPIGSPVNTYRLGGGMFIDHASPTIRDCAFVNNAAGYGGAIYGRYSDSLVENCAFSQNTASTDGGGVQFFAGSPVVRGCTISDNLSTNRGGGLHLVQHTTGGFPTVDGCTITGNRTSVSEGGGISIAPVNGVAQKPLVSNCTIQGNTAQGRGGGLYAPVSATAPQPNATLVNNTICGNTSLISKRENTWALFEDGGNAICDCVSDIDGNGSVNTGDIGFALLFVGDVTDPDYIQPDQDMNGVVDTGDIALLLLNFGQCP